MSECVMLQCTVFTPPKCRRQPQHFIIHSHSPNVTQGPALSPTATHTSDSPRTWHPPVTSPPSPLQASCRETFLTLHLDEIKKAELFLDDSSALLTDSPKERCKRPRLIWKLNRLWLKQEHLGISAGWMVRCA
uniref:Uncharacterized protein n=1 Tax=Knipowitschia caucasica TaxID=637954 RepID=A0AAV2MPW0_KNICA